MSLTFKKEIIKRNYFLEVIACITLLLMIFGASLLKQYFSWLYDINVIILLLASFKIFYNYRNEIVKVSFNEDSTISFYKRKNTEKAYLKKKLSKVSFFYLKKKVLKFGSIKKSLTKKNVINISYFSSIGLSKKHWGNSLDKIIQVLKDKNVLESTGGRYHYNKTDMLGDSFDIHIGSEIDTIGEDFDIL